MPRTACITNLYNNFIRLDYRYARDPEQGSATQEIARNVQEAATGTQEVTSNISGVSQGAEETGRAAGQVLDAASQLSQHTEELRGTVDRVLADIKTA